jgi:hypothetical protein
MRLHNGGWSVMGRRAAEQHQQQRRNEHPRHQLEYIVEGRRGVMALAGIFAGP